MDVMATVMGMVTDMATNMAANMATMPVAKVGIITTMKNNW
jgi:hypothetical protein